MFEFFCPEHGIPALVMWFAFGGDPRILCLTFQMYYARVVELFK